MQKLDLIFDEILAKLLVRHFVIDADLAKENESKAAIARHPRYKDRNLCIRISLIPENKVVAMITNTATFNVDDEIRAILSKKFSQYFGILPHNNIGVDIPIKFADQINTTLLVNMFSTAYNIVKDCEE